MEPLVDFQALPLQGLDFHTAEGFISQIMLVSFGFPVLTMVKSYISQHLIVFLGSVTSHPIHPGCLKPQMNFPRAKAVRYSENPGHIC